MASFKETHKEKRGVTSHSHTALICALASKRKNLPSYWPLKHRSRPWPPQHITLRLPMGMRHRMPIRMAGTDMSVVPVPVAIRRRRLRHPRRITDRAESDRRCMNVIANRLQPLQNGLPLFPIQLTQERPQSLDERILEQRFAVGLRDKEPVQADVQRLGNLLQRAEARRHLAAFDAGQVGARHLRA